MPLELGVARSFDKEGAPPTGSPGREAILLGLTPLDPKQLVLRQHGCELLRTLHFSNSRVYCSQSPYGTDCRREVGHFAPVLYPGPAADIAICSAWSCSDLLEILCHLSFDAAIDHAGIVSEGSSKFLVSCGFALA